MKFSVKIISDLSVINFKIQTNNELAMKNLLILKRLAGINSFNACSLKSTIIRN